MISLGQEDPLEEEMATPPPEFLPGGFHGERSLVGYSPRGCKELDTTEHHSMVWFVINICHLENQSIDCGTLNNEIYGSVKMMIQALDLEGFQRHQNKNGNLENMVQKA